MTGKSRMIRGLTCFTAAASLVLATVPAYGAEVTPPPAPQSPVAAESGRSTSVETSDPSLTPSSTAAEDTENSTNGELEIQESSPETPTPPRRRVTLSKYPTPDQRFYRVRCLQVITGR